MNPEKTGWQPVLQVQGHQVQPIEILLIEDSPSDAGLAERASRRAGITNRIHHVEDGEAALQFVESNGKPDLVLLDLNLPRMDGHELLSELRTNESFDTVPVIVLTSSTQLLDRTTAAAQKASSYLRKPLTAEALFHVLLELDMFDVTLTRRATES